VINWSSTAKRQLKEAYIFLDERNPVAAKKIVDRIYQAARHLHDNPRMGHALNKIIREMMVPHTEYVIHYIVNDNDIDVVGVYHAKQKRPH